MSDKVKVITIPHDKTITMEIGGGFYQRLNTLLIEYSASVPQEELTLAVAKIKANKAQTDPFAYNLETLFVLVRDVERAFQNAGLAVEKQISADDLRDADQM